MLGPEMKAGQTRQIVGHGPRTTSSRSRPTAIEAWDILYAYQDDVAIDLAVVQCEGGRLGGEDVHDRAEARTPQGASLARRLCGCRTAWVGAAPVQSPRPGPPPPPVNSHTLSDVADGAARLPRLPAPVPRDWGLQTTRCASRPRRRAAGRQRSATARARARRRPARAASSGRSAGRCVSSKRFAPDSSAAVARLVGAEVPARLRPPASARSVASQRKRSASRASSASASLGPLSPEYASVVPVRRDAEARTSSCRNAARGAASRSIPAASNGLAVSYSWIVECAVEHVAAARARRRASPARPRPPGGTQSRARASRAGPEHQPPDPGHEIAPVVEVEVRDRDRVDLRPALLARAAGQHAGPAVEQQPPAAALDAGSPNGRRRGSARPASSRRRSTSRSYTAQRGSGRSEW